MLTQHHTRITRPELYEEPKVHVKTVQPARKKTKCLSCDEEFISNSAFALHLMASKMCRKRLDDLLVPIPFIGSDSCAWIYYGTHHIDEDEEPGKILVCGIGRLGWKLILLECEKRFQAMDALAAIDQTWRKHVAGKTRSSRGAETSGSRA